MVKKMEEFGFSYLSFLIQETFTVKFMVRILNIWDDGFQFFNIHILNTFP